MKNLKTLTYTFIFGMLFSASTYAQNTPRGMEDLIDMKAAYLDNELGMEGYKFINTSKSGNDSYQNWYNSNSNKCITVRISNGRVVSIVNSSNYDCQAHEKHYNGYNSNNNYNNNNYNSYPNRYDNTNNSDVVIVYRDKNFTGVNSELSQGYHNFRDLGVGNDQITSIRIPRGYSVTVYSDANYKGRSKTYTSDVAFLGDFNDRISSIYIIKNYNNNNNNRKNKNW